MSREDVKYAIVSMVAFVIILGIIGLLYGIYDAIQQDNWTKACFFLIILSTFTSSFKTK